MDTRHAPTVERPGWSVRLAAMRGAAIVLVVLGHLRPEGGSEAWMVVRRIIFDVHVPLFFVLSGMLWGVGRRAPRHRRGLRWVPRLAVPFAAFTGIPLAGLGLVSLWPANDLGLPPLSADLVLAHLRNPQSGGFAVHLWFLVALFVVKAVYPALLRALRSDLLVLLAALGLSLAPLPAEGCLRLAALHLPLYSAGVIWGRRGRHERPVAARWVWGVTAAAAVAVFGALFGAPRVGPVRLVLGLCGAVLIAAIVRWAARPALRALAALGDQSLEVFLIHPVFVPGALALAAVAGQGARSWMAWAASGAVALLGSWLLAGGVRRIPWAATLLFGEPPPLAAGGHFSVRSRPCDRLQS